MDRKSSELQNRRDSKQDLRKQETVLTAIAKVFRGEIYCKEKWWIFKRGASRSKSRDKQTFSNLERIID